MAQLVTVYDSCVHVGFALKEMGLVVVCAYVVIHLSLHVDWCMHLCTYVCTVA